MSTGDPDILITQFEDIRAQLQSLPGNQVIDVAGGLIQSLSRLAALIAGSRASCFGMLLSGNRGFASRLRSRGGWSTPSRCSTAPSPWWRHFSRSARRSLTELSEAGREVGGACWYTRWTGAPVSAPSRY